MTKVDWTPALQEEKDLTNNHKQPVTHIMKKNYWNLFDVGSWGWILKKAHLSQGLKDESEAVKGKARQIAFQKTACAKALRLI